MTTEHEGAPEADEREALHGLADVLLAAGFRRAAQTTTVTAEQVREAYEAARHVPLRFDDAVPASAEYRWRERDRVYAMLAALGVEVTS